MGRWIQYTSFLVVVLVLAKPVGVYLGRVFERQPTPLDRWLGPLEAMLLRAMGTRPDREMTWREYFTAFVAFGVVGTVFLFLLQMVQAWLPGGPGTQFLTTPMTPHLAANTALSFATTTTWQAYGGETTLRYLVQLIGLVSQNFIAGAAGLAVGVAFIRGFARSQATTLGNFWVDITRALLWVLLPASMVGSLLLVWQGVPVNLSPYTEIKTLEGDVQNIAQGPVATLEFIKNLGTNGGGFFNANGAHPYANPTPLANLLGLLAIAVIPAAFPITFGRMIGRPRVGVVLLTVMVVLFVGGLIVCDTVEAEVPPRLADLGVTDGNMEGKEVRFGVAGSVLAALVTSNGATGSYNSMHDSYQPIGVLVLLLNMLLGEVIFGGLGTGLYSLIMVALLGIVIAGLMVGRTPEYAGKTFRPPETKLIAFYTLIAPLVLLPLTAWASSSSAGRAGLTTNGGPHGFAELVFAFASCFANNGQTMAGLSANSLFFNLTTMIAMGSGRFVLAGLALALAGRLAAQGRRPTSLGTLPCDNVTFGMFVVAAVVLIGLLCFLPALTLGPVVETLQR
jgi:K+-transporting ATPase ATPase A chain